MKNIPFAPKILSAAVLSVLLAACGGGGDDDGTATVAPVVTESSITGTAVKGLLQAAKVTAYKVVDGKKGDKITETTTDNNGAYTLKVSGYSGAVILEMTADASTKMLCDIPTGCEGDVKFNAPIAVNGLVLQTVLPELKATNKTAITPFTHLAAKYAEGKGFNKTNIETALTQIADLFNLPALNDTTAVNPSGNLATANTAEQQYAIMNAAIAQLAGKVADISAKLNALSAEINNNNGQLPSSEAVGKNDKLDLADVLAAAKVVSESNVIKVNAAIQTMLNAQLELAKKTTDLTSATPVSGVGLDDLGKAKAFVNSASLLLSTLQQYGHQSFIDKAKKKVESIQAITDGDSLIFDALGAVTVVMASAVEESQATRQLATAQLNTLFGKTFNNGELEAIASNDLRLSIDAATNTAVLNGEVKLQRKKRQYNNGVWTLVNDGIAKGFTVTNFKISYPSTTASAKEFSVAIDANSKIKTVNVEFGFASGSQSRVTAYFDAANTLQSHIDATDSRPDDSHIPIRAEAKLDSVMLKVLNTPANEISQFVGNVSLTGKRVNLDTTLSGVKRLWPMPEIATLSGKFSSADGDVVESTASVALSEANPLVSPYEGEVYAGIYNYQYNGNNTITVKPLRGTIGWNKVTQVIFSLSGQNCPSGQTRLVADNQTSVYSNCSSNQNIADVYKSAVLNNYWSIRFGLRTEVDNEGEYIPVYPTNFNYQSATASIAGRLIDSDDTLSEDATHQIKGTITANTKIKLVGNAAADIEALVTANYAGQQNGNLTMTVRAGEEKIDITGTTQNGNTTIKLSNKNGVSIDVAESATDANKLELKVNGTVQGWVYKLNGAPVVKFKDDKIKFL